MRFALGQGLFTLAEPFVGAILELLRAELDIAFA
jgi:hypothetical protein